MSTARIWQTESTSLKDTLDLAAQIGSKLRGGEVIVLVSDLGGGKTAFVRGLALGMGIKEAVKSPSFTLGNQYQGGKLTLHHLDFYRLSTPGIMLDSLAEILDDPKAVVVIEWAEVVKEVLPNQRLTVNLRVTGETRREIRFEYPKRLKYLLTINT